MVFVDEEFEDFAGDIADKEKPKKPDDPSTLSSDAKSNLNYNETKQRKEAYDVFSKSVKYLWKENAPDMPSKEARKRIAKGLKNVKYWDYIPHKSPFRFKVVLPPRKDLFSNDHDHGKLDMTLVLKRYDDGKKAIRFEGYDDGYFKGHSKKIDKAHDALSNEEFVRAKSYLENARTDLIKVSKDSNLNLDGNKTATALILLNEAGSPLKSIDVHSASPLKNSYKIKGIKELLNSVKDYEDANLIVFAAKAKHSYLKMATTSFSTYNDDLPNVVKEFEGRVVALPILIDILNSHKDSFDEAIDAITEKKQVFQSNSKNGEVAQCDRVLLYLKLYKNKIDNAPTVDGCVGYFKGLKSEEEEKNGYEKYKVYTYNVIIDALNKSKTFDAAISAVKKLKKQPAPEGHKKTKINAVIDEAIAYLEKQKGTSENTDYSVGTVIANCTYEKPQLESVLNTLKSDSDSEKIKSMVAAQSAKLDFLKDELENFSDTQAAKDFLEGHIEKVNDETVEGKLDTPNVQKKNLLKAYLKITQALDILQQAKIEAGDYYVPLSAAFAEESGIELNKDYIIKGAASSLPMTGLQLLTENDVRAALGLDPLKEKPATNFDKVIKATWAKLDGRPEKKDPTKFIYAFANSIKYIPGYRSIQNQYTSQPLDWNWNGRDVTFSVVFLNGDDYGYPGEFGVKLYSSDKDFQRNYLEKNYGDVLQSASDKDHHEKKDTFGFVKIPEKELREYSDHEKLEIANAAKDFDVIMRDAWIQLSNLKRTNTNTKHTQFIKTFKEAVEGRPEILNYLRNGHTYSQMISKGRIFRKPSNVSVTYVEDIRVETEVKDSDGVWRVKDLVVPNFDDPNVRSRIIVERAGLRFSSTDKDTDEWFEGKDMKFVPLDLPEGFWKSRKYKSERDSRPLTDYIGNAGDVSDHDDDPIRTEIEKANAKEREVYTKAQEEQDKQYRKSYKDANTFVQHLRESNFGIEIAPGNVFDNPYNPYRNAFVDFAKKKKIKLKGKIWSAYHYSGGLRVKINSLDGDWAQTVDFTGDAYKAIFWPEIVKKLQAGFEMVDSGNYHGERAEKRFAYAAKIEGSPVYHLVNQIAESMSAEKALGQMFLKKDKAKSDFQKAIDKAWSDRWMARQERTLLFKGKRGKKFMNKMEKYPDLQYLEEGDIVVDGLRVKDGRGPEKLFRAVFVRNNAGYPGIRLESEDRDLNKKLKEAGYKFIPIPRRGSSKDHPVDSDKLRNLKYSDPFLSNKVLVGACISQLNGIDENVDRTMEAARTRSGQLALNEKKFRSIEEKERHATYSPTLVLNESGDTEDTVEDFKNKANVLRLDSWSLRIRSVRESISPDKWQVHNSPKDRARVRYDIEKMGIASIYSPMFLEGIFNQLRKSTDGAFLDDLKDPKVASWYKDPANHLSDLQKIDPLFHKAYTWYEILKDAASDAVNRMNDDESKFRKHEKGGIVGQGADFIRSHAQKIQRAFKSGDWTTVAMYVAIGLGINYGWKSKRLKDFFTKERLFGLDLKTMGAFAGIAIAIDHVTDGKLVKAIGLRDVLSEVNGTAMESLRNHVPQIESKDDGPPLDGNVYVKARDISVGRLMEHYNSDNSLAPQFIDPKKFRQFSREFTGSSRRLLREDSYYKKVGEQLYALAKYLGMGYAATYKLDPESRFKGQPFQTALAGHPFSSSTVMEFAGSLDDYIPNGKGRKFDRFYSGSGKVIEARLAKAFGKDIQYNISAQTMPNEGKGYIHGLPVRVFVDKAKGKCYVYDLIDINRKPSGKLSRNESAMIGSFALDGSDVENGNVAALKVTIENRVKGMVENVKYAGEKIVADELEFKEGKWVFNVNIPGEAGKTKARTVQAELLFYPNPENGRSYDFTIDNEPFSLSGKNGGIETGAEHIKWEPVLLRMVNYREANGPNFGFLEGLALSKKMKMKSATTGDASSGIFVISVGGFEFKVKHTPGDDNFKGERFELHDITEAEILENKDFREAYVDRLQESTDFKALFSDFDFAIEAADQQEDLFKHFGYNLWEMVKNFDASRTPFEGGVNKWAAMEEVRIMQDFLAQSLEGSLKRAGSFENASLMYENLFEEGTNKLETTIKEIFSSDQKWTREKFSQKMGEAWAAVGMDSSEYSGLYEDLGLEGVALNNNLSKTDLLRINKMKTTFIHYTAPHVAPQMDTLLYPPETRMLPRLKAASKGATPGADKNYKEFLVKKLCRDPKRETLLRIKTDASSDSLRSYEFKVNNQWINCVHLYAGLGYSSYVKKEVKLKAKKLKVAKNPDWLSAPFGGIQTFDKWISGKSDEDLMEPINEVDKDPPMDNTERNQDKFDRHRSKLEAYFEKKYIEMIKKLIRESNITGGQKFDRTKLMDLLAYFTGYDVRKEGDDRWYEYKNYGETLPNGTTDKRIGIASPKCPLAITCKAIAANTKNRSDQLKTIDNILEYFEHSEIRKSPDNYPHLGIIGRLELFMERLF